MKTRCVIKVAGNVVLAREASGTEVVNPRFHARIEEQIVCQERVGLVALHLRVVSHGATWFWWPEVHPFCVARRLGSRGGLIMGSLRWPVSVNSASLLEEVGMILLHPVQKNHA